MPSIGLKDGQRARGRLAAPARGRRTGRWQDSHALGAGGLAAEAPLVNPSGTGGNGSRARGDVLARRASAISDAHPGFSIGISIASRRDLDEAVERDCTGREPARQSPVSSSMPTRLVEIAPRTAQEPIHASISRSPERCHRESIDCHLNIYSISSQDWIFDLPIQQV